VSPAKRPTPGRALGLVLVVLAALYGGMALSGRYSPALGLDLRGGTTVTLTPSSPGQKIDKDDLNQSVDIIRQRVDGLGVSSAEVSTEGNNIVIAVPGKGRADVLDLVGKTALLDFRPVTDTAVATTATPSASPSAAASGSAAATPSASTTASPSASPVASPAASTATIAPSTSGSPKSLGEPGSTSKTGTQDAAYSLPRAASASPTASPSAAATASPTASSSASPAASPAASATPLPEGQSALKAPETAPTAAENAAYAAIDCNLPKNQAGGTAGDPNKYIVGCGEQSGVWSKYLLAPVLIPGTQVTGVAAGLGSDSVTWVVNMSFKGSAVGTWATYTTKHAGDGSLIAVVLDGVVQSAETIQSAIPDGNTQISGSFTHKTANQLAQVLKYGSLKIAFKTQTAEDISATLGNSQLKAGLLAGAIGLALVLLYSFFYYRGLSLVTVLSLALSGAIQYPLIVILGKTISYTLSLAGIAGLIVAVGITADSFVVFFERLRDEVREGNSLRTAVEKAWPRARRTILSADLVSLLAAGVLYWRAVGDVKGFAFTLGLSTATDLFIVFFFTKPMITLLAQTKFYGQGARWSGLDPNRLGVKNLSGRVEVRRTGLAGTRRSPATAREEGTL
jgi:preprotein translocase subunit SecD